MSTHNIGFYEAILMRTYNFYEDLIRIIFQYPVTQTFLLDWEKVASSIYHYHHLPMDQKSLSVLLDLPHLFYFWSLCIYRWWGSHSEGAAFVSLFLDSLACHFYADFNDCSFIFHNLKKVLVRHIVHV